MWVRLVLVVRTVWWHLGWGLFARIWCPRLACTGLERVPQGPVILAANHASHADTVILQLLLVRKGRRKVLVAGAADYWFRNPALGLLARFLGVFPFPRSGGEGVGRACKALRRGWSVLIFPQGTRSGGPFRPGASFIAADSRVPVVPVTITGTDALLPRGHRLPKRAVVTVRFGAPLQIASWEDPHAFVVRVQDSVFDTHDAEVAA
jgi:1-acyl-sn-glycerol-3-phosphate acyltransferase